MIKFIEEKVENYSMRERSDKVDGLMNTIIWGNEYGFTGEMEKYPSAFISEIEQETDGI